jgi:gluconokinase
VTRRTSVVVGVDIGTSATKAAAYDGRGRCRARAAAAYPVLSERPGWAEQDPDAVVSAVLSALAEVAGACYAAGAAMEAVAVGGAMHSLVGVGRDGRPVTRALTWADGRAHAQAGRLRARTDAAALYRATGTPLQSMAPLSKLMWFREEAPETFARAARWMSLKDYVILTATGDAVTDHSIASATGLFDVVARRWHEPALQLAGVRREQLPRPVAPTHTLHRLDESVAARARLRPMLPLVIGASDGALGTLGLGVRSAGLLACNVGTSAALRTLVSEPALDPKGRTFCYAFTDGLWLTGVATNSGGAALRWLRDQVLGDTYDNLLESAARVPAGAEGLLFLPYLLGERAPQWDPHARAVLFGLTPRHGRAHIVRAVIEGVALQLARAAAPLERAVGTASEVRASGGAMASRLWRQIVADALRRTVAYPTERQSGCLGAALVGMQAIGMIASAVDVALPVEIDDERRPSPAAPAYERLAHLFEDLYRDLRPAFGALTSGATADSRATGPRRPGESSRG